MKKGKVVAKSYPFPTNPIIFTMTENKILATAFNVAYNGSAPLDPVFYASPVELEAWKADHYKIEYAKLIPSSFFNLNDQNTFYVKTSYSEYIHNDEMWSSYEKCAPITFIIGCNAEGTVLAPYAHQLEAFNRKTTVSRETKIRDLSTVVFITVPTENSKLTDCVVKFRFHQKYGLIGNFIIQPELDQHFNDPTSFNQNDILDYLPIIKVDGPTTVAPDSTIELTVNVIDNETNLPLNDGLIREIFIENTGGYINKKRILVDESGSSFKFVSQDLNSGDKIKLKFGWKHTTGLVDHYITII